MPENGGLGGITIGGLSRLGGNNYLPSDEVSATLQFTDNLTKQVGRHSMKVGFQFQQLRFSILQPPQGRGAFSFVGAHRLSE